MEHAERSKRLILIMALAMYWCVRLGRGDALSRPTPLEKSSGADRPQPLELPKALPQLSLVVQARAASPEAMPSK